KRRCAWKSRKKRGIPTFPQPQQQQTFGYISNVSTTPAKVTFLDGLTGPEHILNTNSTRKVQRQASRTEQRQP
ncbi:MAG TPA: hypothetical protein VGF61_22620, partial [Candidatus Acidoferrum sp.]